MQFLQHRAAVIALVSDDLLDGTFMDLARRRLRFRQGPVNRIGVAVAGRLQRDGQHCAARQVDRMFGLVRQMRASILHLRDACIRVGGTHPFLVRALLFSFPIQPRQRDYWRSQPHLEEWLLVEWPRGEAEPTKYWLSTLPADTKLGDLVRLAKQRWIIERDYQELKQELGLGHFEGRGWRGFHH